jgi:pyridoxal biosynthesis lyase PdxS
MHALIKTLVLSGSLLATTTAASAGLVAAPADVGAALAAQPGCAGVFVMARAPAEVASAPHPVMSLVRDMSCPAHP